MCPEEVQELLDALKVSNLTEECLDTFSQDDGTSGKKGGAMQGCSTLGIGILLYLILVCHLLLFGFYHRIHRACDQSRRTIEALSVLVAIPRAYEMSLSTPPPAYRARPVEGSARQTDDGAPATRAQGSPTSGNRTQNRTSLYPQLPLTDSC